jgi:phage shock protein A
MIKLIQRAWRYMTAALTGRFNEAADPKVQLEQAITEAQDQHRRLVQQAANVVANQKQTEMRLNRAIEDVQKQNGLARQAVTMAEDATKRGDTAKAVEYTSAAESFANRLVASEREVESLKELLLQATQAANSAKSAVQQNSLAMQKRLSERQKLLGQLDQAKMQEQVNSAMAALNETVGQDVPTFEEVRQKIETRYAKALGTSEITGQSVEQRMLEVEQASINTEAQAKLSEIRTQLGLSGPNESGGLSGPTEGGGLGAGPTADQPAIEGDGATT